MHIEMGEKINTKRNMPMKKTDFFSQYIKNWQIVMFMIPGLILLLIFAYGPMFGLLIAFKDYKMALGVFESEWVGLEHFRRLFTGNDFLNVLKNTVTISFLKLIVNFPLPIILALLLNEMRNATYKKIVQTFSYLPHFFSWVVMGGIVMMLFSNGGPVNDILINFGMEKPISFFGNGFWFVVLLLISSVWQGIGWSSIVYISALSAVDQSLYEAATVDGASRWKQTLHISIPAILPTIVTVLILNMGQILNGGFDQIFNLYNPSVYETADILDTFVYRKLQTMDYSLGTAVGLFKSFVGMIMVIVVNGVVKKLTDGENSVF